jgi:hypothetical protein
VAPPKEQSESASLPRPELNPLLNPLLGENMGRWAEVYFTAAPEKREEAVVELLRELETGGSGAETAAKSESDTVRQPFADADIPMPDFSAGDFASADRQSHRQCQACGHDNPATHQFCGMCGDNIFRRPQGRFPVHSLGGSRLQECALRFCATPSI